MTSGSANRIRVAVPSETPGGMDAARSGHFGRSPSFTLVDLVDGDVAAVGVVSNGPHGQDGCMTPVVTLGENMVDVVIVAGIGHRPLLGCVQAGIRVFAGDDQLDVRGVIQAFMDMELSPVGPDATCLH